MLTLNNITKKYITGDVVTDALRGVSMSFRRSEFVAVLGPSGCGKTTLLNIIGGLDRYTDGDLIINGVSTKKYRDRDWDEYRNHSIGFVFQSYNLIPHQTALANVELALTLSGVSKSERRRRATEALISVGLGDQLKKKQGQMSGGQIQRVAIARALVNDPDILLADEPTGALDTETSIQVMELLKEAAKTKLVIMVTHNPTLAEKYATRTIRLLDGNVVSDDMPYEGEPVSDTTTGKIKHKRVRRKNSMSLFTALSLSLNNLLTKKTRTFLTSFAGSIGIIGIALILAMSSGFQLYIDRVQNDTLSTYPLTIQKQSIDLTTMMANAMKDRPDGSETQEREDGRVYVRPVLSKMGNTMFTQTVSNDLSAFRSYIESDASDILKYSSAIKYTYDVKLNIYKADTSESVVRVNPSDLMSSIYGENSGMMASLYSSSSDLWTEMLDNDELLSSQYDVIAGRWPEEYNEVVFVVDENNEISDYTLYSLGLRDQAEIKEFMNKLLNGEEIIDEFSDLTYEDILGLSFKLVLESDMYVKNESGVYKSVSDDKEALKNVVDNGTDIKIVGIIRPSPDAVATSINGSVGYLRSLTEYVIKNTDSSEAVISQKNDPKTDIFTGLPFEKRDASAITMDDVNAYVASLSADEQTAIRTYMSRMTEEQILAMFAERIASMSSDATYDGNLDKLGIADLSSPDSISIYPVDFDSKDEIEKLIKSYNASVSADGHEEKKITYTDYIGLFMSSISTIINTITYVLIAFVSVSLVVSSIMIGIITYISVLERTKEIGILRSIGASKRDISRVFNCETFIVGTVSGLLGIGVTVLLTLPVNLLIKALADISNIAVLPWQGAVILVLISMILTVIAGLIPASLASKKDPVVALRLD